MADKMDKTKPKKTSLSAARKMLKEYQQNQATKKSSRTDDNPSPTKNETSTPIDSMASSTHSSIIQETQSHDNILDAFTNTVSVDNGQQNFFNTALFQSGGNNHLLSNYFDYANNYNVQCNRGNYGNVEGNFYENQGNVYENNQGNAFGNNETNIYGNVQQNSDYNQYQNTDANCHNPNLQNYYDINRQQNDFNQNIDNSPNIAEAVNTQYVEEIQCQNDYESDRTKSEVTEDMIPSTKNFIRPVDKQSAFLDSPNLDDDENVTIATTNPEIVNIKSEMSKSTVSDATPEIKSEIPNIETEVTKSYSNTESLRQLSSQLTSLIDSTESFPVTATSELERRNQELASLLNSERQKTEQLNLQIREYMNRITHLETESHHQKTDYETKLSREIGPLQEQLQYHVQTVGILVGEKTELTVSLNQSQTTLKQKTSECEELQGRLRASRHRVSELEKEVNALKSLKENVNKTENEYAREIERLKSEYKLLKDQHDEVNEECTEFKEKLAIKTTEMTTLQKEVTEKNSQLSLAELRIQQLTVGENLQTESQLELLNQQKIALEQQVAELLQTVKLVSSERDQASIQYQQYVQQLNGQLQNLAGQLQEKSTENDTLSQRENSLIKHIGELEKHLQQLQLEKQTPVINESPPIVTELENNIVALESTKKELENKHQEEVRIREELQQELIEKMKYIGELEFKCERLMTDRPDAGKLLAAMESDKVAAARATEQNQKLKEQLAELQDGFVKMSNSKLELTEKLESEEHHCRELSEQLTQKENDVENLHRTISCKDNELMRNEEVQQELNKQLIQQTQLLDRLRHYEAQGNVMDLLQQELKEANKSLTNLTAENTELHMIIEEMEKKMKTENKSEGDSHDKSGDVTDDGLSEIIRRKIELLEKTNQDLEMKIKDMGNVDNPEYLDTERAIEKLEEKFKKTMSEVAELTDEKQRLEHLVLQLQSETETIGEYVTLYQCQRAMLKQKTMEKDEQLARLTSDREEMKVKLEELNNLIRKLVLEKGDIPEELLNNKIYNNYYCEIHKDNIDTKVENVEINENNNLGTAGQIIALLSEIKTSNLVQPNDNIQNFHPCPWCSGKLITV